MSSWSSYNNPRHNFMLMPAFQTLAPIQTQFSARARAIRFSSTNLARNNMIFFSIKWLFKMPTVIQAAGGT